MTQANSDPKVIGKNLKALRLGNHLTVAQLAHRSGVPERTIQRVEAGENIRPDALQDLADTFGAPLDLLRIDIDNPPEPFKQILAGEGPLRSLRASRVLAALDVDTLKGEMFLSHRDPRLTEEALDLVAEIQEAIETMVDVYLDMDHQARWEESKRIAALLERLDQAGGALLTGNEPAFLKPSKEAQGAVPFTLLVCAYVPKESQPPVLFYDRRQLPAGMAFKKVPAPTSGQPV